MTGSKTDNRKRTVSSTRVVKINHSSIRASLHRQLKPKCALKIEEYENQIFA